MARPNNRRQGKRERRREAQRCKIAARAERRHRPAISARTEAPSAADPITGTTGPTIHPHLHWYIARIEPRMGDRAVKALEKHSVATVIPRVSEIVSRSGRRVVRSRQLLLRRAFLGVTDDHHLETARAQEGVADIVSFPHPDAVATGNVEGVVMVPVRLDPVTLQRFVDSLSASEIVAPYGVKAKDTVTVLSGPFAGFPGIVETILPGDRVKVGVSLFGRAVPVELGLAEVKALA